MSVVERGCEAHLGPHGVGVRRHLLVAVAVGSLRLRGSLRRGEGRHGQRAREANGGSPSFRSTGWRRKMGVVDDERVAV